MNDSPEDNEALLRKEEEEEKGKRARRSKADNDGRNYDCSFCGKSYLSYPALYTHKKNKHREEENKIVAESAGGKSRGRPKSKANESENGADEKIVSAETSEYFSTAERKGETSSDLFSQIFQDIFNEIFVEQWDSIFKNCLKGFIKYTQFENYPLYKEFLDHHKNSENMGTGDIKCDQVFAEYLYHVSKITNSVYFKKVVKFVFLYREFLNRQHRKDKNEEYTETQSAEDAPDLSNEFLIDFIKIEDPIMGYSKDESTQLTQNFCRWMFDENYTTSKLTMK